ncbi:MAG: response regulator [Acidobacteriota bacterium]
MTRSGGPASVLVVDDEEDIVEYLCAVLEDHGYRALPATGAREALSLAGRERPDLVVLDIMMPGQTGLSLYRQLRALPGMRDTPVLILSGVARAEDSEPSGAPSWLDTTLEGPYVYLEKPIQPNRLLARLAELLPSGG